MNDFTLSPTGVTFSDWNSIPMADKACGGDVDGKVSRTVTFEELEPYAREDLARYLRMPDHH